MDRGDLLSISENLTDMYRNIITYLTEMSEEKYNEEYNYLRLFLDKIFNYQNKLNKKYKKYKEEKSLTTDEFIEIIDLVYKDIYNSFYIYNLFYIHKKEINDKFSRYQSSNIFNNESKDEINLEKLLREDAVVKASKTYFDILDEKYGMSLDKYLFYHKLPDNNLSDEQAVIKDIIDCLEMDLWFSLSMIYGFCLSKYLYYQNELSYFELKILYKKCLLIKSKLIIY